MAKVVIRIGRSRIGRLQDRLPTRKAPGPKDIRVIDKQNPVLLHQPHEEDQADEAEDIERLSRQKERPEGPDERERHGQEHR
jgi:hypothetical protein